MDSPITNLIERGLTSFWRVLKVSYIEKNHLYRLQFGYKSCFSFTNVAFRVQKLRFAYKYLIVNLQNCISNYKVASRNAIQQVKCKCIKRPFMYQQFLRGCILKTGIGSIKMKSQEGKYESEKFV